MAVSIYPVATSGDIPVYLVQASIQVYHLAKGNFSNYWVIRC